jgi:hypothetical protein
VVTSHDLIINNISSLISLLKNKGIEASVRSHLENDYLIAHQFVESYKEGKIDNTVTDGLAALGGLNELYQWIWPIKDSPEFYRILLHLKMLTESATRINSATPYLSPVTGKQDEKSNKLIETIIGMYAIKVGSCVELDDPVKSSNGTNSDVIFTYYGTKVAFACKTLQRKSDTETFSEMTFLDNLRSAARQINRAACDYGYIVINAMNIIQHEKIKDNVFKDDFIPMEIISSDIKEKYSSARVRFSTEMHDIFEGGKVRPIILTFIHSVTKLIFHSFPPEIRCTMLKGTFATDMCVGEYDLRDDIVLLSGINEFIHNRL